MFRDMQFTRRSISDSNKLMFSFPRKFGYKLFSHYCTQGVIGINHFPVNKKKWLKKLVFKTFFTYSKLFDHFCASYK